jgi:hypothetical protein
MDKTRAAMSHISGFSLDIYLAMPKRSVAAAPNISHSYILGIFEYFCSECIQAYFCIKNNPGIVYNSYLA